MRKWRYDKRTSSQNTRVITQNKGVQSLLSSSTEDSGSKDVGAAVISMRLLSLVWLLIEIWGIHPPPPHLHSYGAQIILTKMSVIYLAANMAFAAFCILCMPAYCICNQKLCKNNKKGCLIWNSDSSVWNKCWRDLIQHPPLLHS